MAACSIHVKIAQHFRERIASGALRPGDRLPPEPELAARFRCSVGTVRRAMNSLIHEGSVQPRQGVGVFVCVRPRRKILGAIVHNVRDPDHAHLVEQLTAAAGRRGYSVMLCVPHAENVSHPRGIRTEMEFIERFADLRGAGIVKCPTFIEAEERLRTRMRRRDVPLVVVNDYWTDCHDVHHVECDRQVGMGLALDHLAQFGHKRIAFHLTPRNLAPSAADAFRKAARDRALQGELLLQGGNETLQAVASREGGRRVTAVVTLYYPLACDLVQQFQEAGVRVPEDVALVVLSGLPDKRLRPVDFTTVEPPLADMARSALGLLLQDEPAPISHLRFAPTLRTGATSGPFAHQGP